MFINKPSNLAQNLIVVIYKGKVLLTSKDSLINFNEKNVWSFPDKKRSLEFGQSKVDMVSFDNWFHYIKLTDKNVLAIKRQDGKRLEFYKPAELELLILDHDTKLLYSSYKEEIKKLLIV